MPEVADGLEAVGRRDLRTRKSAREGKGGRGREDLRAREKKCRETGSAPEKNEARAAEFAARVGALEPLGEQVQRYKSALEKSLAAEKKDLPKHVLVLLEKLDPVEQIEYLAVNREELGNGNRARLEGVPASPSPKERALNEDDQAAARRGQAALYSNF